MLFENQILVKGIKPTSLANGSYLFSGTSVMPISVLGIGSALLSLVNGSFQLVD